MPRAQHPVDMVFFGPVLQWVAERNLKKYSKVISGNLTETGMASGWSPGQVTAHRDTYRERVRIIGGRAVVMYSPLIMRYLIIGGWAERCRAGASSQV